MIAKFISQIFRPVVLDNYENVVVFGPQGEKEIRAKVDTGAVRTSLDINEAKSLGLVRPENIVGRQSFESGLGQQHRDIIKIKFLLKGREIQTTASVTDRSHMSHKMLIGRMDMGGFLVKPDPVGEGK